ncbi:hypothetical protein [Armatimonas rosea]|uniref:DNA-directed RNA polymerase specialized sigma24 family protein n=1 Tax=Armatimonas rosea TaxID=685828 RepID=A0A7W9ST14_ARMRO|nr:hypothetical protein [Armatimonas rosea]MBB6051478.1 DNA-directed RNA polymerase specialized sigma24 family protein [Armatimonas rosea]
MSTVIEPEESIVQLRWALRSGDSASIDRAVAPLIEALWQPLVDQARRMVRSSWRPLGLEGEDLVQEAWLRALTYLTEPAGEGIQTQEHLQRLLLRMVRQRFLDSVDRAEGRDDQEYDEGKAEAQAGQEELGEGLLWLEEGPRQQLLGALFESEEAFQAACARKPKRRRRHYQAYVLFLLATYYRTEVLASAETAAIFQRYVSLLGVASEDWRVLEQAAALPESGDSELFAAVNTVCGTTLAERGALYVFRYELGQLAGER